MPVNTAVNTKTAPTVVLPSGFSFDTSYHAKKISIMWQNSKLGKTNFLQPSVANDDDDDDREHNIVGCLWQGFHA